MLRPRHGRWLVLTGAFLLQGCPQLLDDEFLSTAPSPSSSGPAPCTGACGVEVPPVPEPTDAGTPTPPPPPKPKPPKPPPSPDASVPPEPPPGPGEAPACWTVALNDSTHIADNNCLDIHGWNSAVVDEEDGDTSVTRTYADGKVCLAGQLDSEGWGMVYNLTFANDEPWNAATRGVSGLKIDVSGPNPPPQVEVIYTMDYTVDGNRDYCRALEPFVTATVPFASTHPGCSTSADSGTPDISALTHLRLHFPPGNSVRPFDFCLSISGAP